MKRTSGAQQSDGSLLVKVSDTGGAVFDRRGKYRYLLWRELSAGSSLLVLVMLNPNKADHENNDPTIRRCISFARNWGYARLEVVNLFAIKAQEPAMLKTFREPIGRENDRFILDSAQRASRVLVAWGNHGSIYQRSESVVRLLAESDLFCLGTTKSGMPRHPLYVQSNCEPARYFFDERESR